MVGGVGGGRGCLLFACGSLEVCEGSRLFLLRKLCGLGVVCSL